MNRQLIIAFPFILKRVFGLTVNYVVILIIGVTLELFTWGHGREGGGSDCRKRGVVVVVVGMTMEMSLEVCMGLQQVDQHLQKIKLDNSEYV